MSLDMGDEPTQQGITSLLQWNALLISFALFLTLIVLGTITAKNDWTNIGILIVLIIIALALLITSADFSLKVQKVLQEELVWLRLLLG